MPQAGYEVGEAFPVQFVWELPDGDYVRAVFEAEVLALDFSLDRYLLRLRELKAGRQETPAGEMQPVESFARDYWALVGQLIGKRIYLAFEADDARPLKLRLETLTQEHSFFTRLDSGGDEAPLAE
ncbi:MAG: hypothetical protein R3272_17395 [Candidatus Promineifilaceae bacterium]|nr:hypothetical protein [Candidatus Promineifilaceae bacterium]